MAVYQEMKDSGYPFIGAIPQHWRIIRVKNILNNYTEKNHPDAEVLSLYRDLGVLPKNSRSDNHNVTSEDTSQYKFVRAGDLVINKMKAWQGSLAVSEYTGIVSPAYYVCKFTDNDINKQYIHYLLRCCSYAQEFEKLSTGMRIGQWDLGIDDFMKIPLAIPPITEQAGIAAYLDKTLVQIDSLITEAKASIEEYKKWKASIIYEAVTKGLDPDVEMKDSGVDIIGNIPVHWRLYRLKYLCDVMTGNQDTQNAVDDGKYPFYVRSPIIQRTNTYTYEGEGILMAGDGAGAGRVFHYATGKYAIHQRVYCFHNFRNIMPQFFLYYISELFKKVMDKGSAQSTVPSVRLPMIQDFIFAIPPAREQAQIIEFLNKKCETIDSLIFEKESLISDLESYKKSLIYEVVTGKRKVV